ncbi:MAG: amidohydrolase family protein [Nitrososphaerales archaeon]
METRDTMPAILLSADLFPTKYAHLPKNRKIIDFETHIQATEFIKEVMKYEGYPRYRYDSKGRLVVDINPEISEVRERIRKVSEDPKARIDDMDRAGIDVQVISSSNPGCEVFPQELGVKLARVFNDQLGDWISRYPDRIVGLASLPIQDADAAMIELDRISNLGFKGLMLFSNVNGGYVDGRNLWPIFLRAEKLGFPIFLHPGYPLNLEALMEGGLWGSVFGFGVDAATAALRMIMNGVFEEIPGLKVILGHMGETIPYILNRIDIVYNRSPGSLARIKKKPSEYFLENFYVDTCGVRSEPALMCAFESLRRDRVLFASDYPFGDAGEEVALVEKSRIPESEQKKIFWDNSAGLLGL